MRQLEVFHQHVRAWIIPQGSVMGPLIFIVFINDIVNVSSDTRITMFADDTRVVLTKFL